MSKQIKTYDFELGKITQKPTTKMSSMEKVLKKRIKYIEKIKKVYSEANKSR